MNWLTSTEAAHHSRRHPVTIRRALACGELHGHQPLRGGHPVPGSKWQIPDVVIDLWVQGHDPQAQARACGCTPIRAVGRAG